MSGLREILVIPDGAAERADGRPTSLELAATPVLDTLAEQGEVSATLTTPPGLAPGSEVGLATLLGAKLTAQPSRGMIEAAATGIAVPAGRSAWRVDLYREGRRFAAEGSPHVTQLLQSTLPGHVIHHLRGHRFLAVGSKAPRIPQIGVRAHVWGGEGTSPPRILDHTSVLICAQGAAAGVAITMGAAVIVPDGATGGRDTDLQAKADAAICAAREGAKRVVVHVAWPDEAAHERDRESKIRALEQIDRVLLAPLYDAAMTAGALLEVCPDHGTDPDTGAHLGGPMPRLRVGRGVAPGGPSRLSEHELLAGAQLSRSTAARSE